MLIGNFTAHGVRRLALVNTGVSTEKPIDEVVAANAASLLALHMRLLGKSADALLDHKEGGHADERETSVMLALEPSSVRMDKLELASEEKGGPFERTGATGDPRRASAFKGERQLAARVDDMVAALVSRWPDLA
jgi:creatinine amidohydrolase